MTRLRAPQIPSATYLLYLCVIQSPHLMRTHHLRVRAEFRIIHLVGMTGGHRGVGTLRDFRAYPHQSGDSSPVRRVNPSATRTVEILCRFGQSALRFASTIPQHRHSLILDVRGSGVA